MKNRKTYFCCLLLGCGLWQPIQVLSFLSKTSFCLRKIVGERGDNIQNIPPAETWLFVLQFLNMHAHSPSYTHSLSLSLYLFHTHTHTYTHQVYLTYNSFDCFPGILFSCLFFSFCRQYFEAWHLENGRSKAMMIEKLKINQ